MGQGFQNLLTFFSERREAEARAYAERQLKIQQVASAVSNLAKGFVELQNKKNEYKYMAERAGVYDPDRPLDYSRLNDRLDERLQKLERQKEALNVYPDISGAPESEPGFHDESVAQRLSRIEKKQEEIESLRQSPLFQKRLEDERWRAFYRNAPIGSPEFYGIAEMYTNERQREMEEQKAQQKVRLTAETTEAREKAKMSFRREEQEKKREPKVIATLEKINKLASKERENLSRPAAKELDTLIISTTHEIESAQTQDEVEKIYADFQRELIRLREVPGGIGTLFKKRSGNREDEIRRALEAARQ